MPKGVEQVRPVILHPGADAGGKVTQCSQLVDVPFCLLLLGLDETRSKFMSCKSKCSRKPQMCEKHGKGMKHWCREREKE